nr:BrnA antitoxin family protein [Methylocucumis oryzae]
MNATEIRAGIDSDLDAQATDDNFWSDAEVVMPKPKQVVTIRLDADLLDWFRKENGYQTRINAILRAYMKANDHRTGHNPSP